MIKYSEEKQQPSWLNIAMKTATNMIKYSDENSNQHD